MRVRSTHFKVQDMEAEVSFWRARCINPALWSEFLIGSTRVGFLLNDFDEQLSGCGSVPVFEVNDGEITATIARATQAGATVVLDGRDNPKMNSIMLASPGAHEFELCDCKAHD